MEPANPLEGWTFTVRPCGHCLGDRARKEYTLKMGAITGCGGCGRWYAFAVRTTTPGISESWMLPSDGWDHEPSAEEVGAAFAGALRLLREKYQK